MFWYNVRVNCFLFCFFGGFALLIFGLTLGEAKEHDWLTNIFGIIGLIVGPLLLTFSFAIDTHYPEKKRRKNAL